MANTKVSKTIDRVTSVEALESAALEFEYQASEAATSKNYSYRNLCISYAKELRQLKNSIKESEQAKMITGKQGIKQVSLEELAAKVAELNATVKAIQTAVTSRNKARPVKENPFFSEAQTSFEDVLFGRNGGIKR